MIRNLTFAAVAAVLAAPSAHAQSAAKAPVDDTLFAKAAACSGMSEMALAEMGMKKATDPVLKKFSELMVKEHSKLNDDLKALASKKKVTLPTTLSDGAKFCGESLSGLSGEEFDRAYAHAQFVGHMEAMATFEAEAKRGSDQEMKAFAEKAVPHIREHLHEIRPIAMKYMMEHWEEHAEKRIEKSLEKDNK